MGSGAAPGLATVGVHPLVVERARRVVVPDDVRTGDRPARELHPGIAEHPEEEVEPVRSRRRAPVTFSLLARRREARVPDVRPATGRTPRAIRPGRAGTRSAWRWSGRSPTRSLRSPGSPIPHRRAESREASGAVVGGDGTWSGCHRCRGRRPSTGVVCGTVVATVVGTRGRSRRGHRGRRSARRRGRPVDRSVACRRMRSSAARGQEEHDCRSETPRTNDATAPAMVRVRAAPRAPPRRPSRHRRPLLRPPGRVLQYTPDRGPPRPLPGHGYSGPSTTWSPHDGAHARRRAPRCNVRHHVHHGSPPTPMPTRRQLRRARRDSWARCRR